MDKLYTLEQAAALPGFPVTAVTLRKYLNAGKLHGVKIGPEPEPGRLRRRPWYLTSEGLKKVPTLEARRPGRPKKS